MVANMTRRIEGMSSAQEIDEKSAESPNIRGFVPRKGEEAFWAVVTKLTRAGENGC